MQIDLSCRRFGLPDISDAEPRKVTEWLALSGSVFHYCQASSASGLRSG